MINGRAGVIAIGSIAGIAGLIFTVLYTQIESTKNALSEHTNPVGGHTRTQEEMATFRQQLAEQTIKSGDRFTNSDWIAAKELLMAIIDALDKRLKVIEERHVRDTERERNRLMP